jgi:hypothetical protein
VTSLCGRLAGTAVALAAVSGCVSPAPRPVWIDAFGYAGSDIHALTIGDFGFPYIPVRIGSVDLMLPFDTGNMVGLSVSSELFDRLGLTADGSYGRVNSAGETVAVLRVADAVHVAVLDRDPGPTRIYELDQPDLPGLVGPGSIQAGHFTLDYRSRTMAVGTGTLPDSVPGFRQIPLVRSGRHPGLILVHGTIEGHGVVLELDTGKSRTVINPALSSALALRRGRHGVAIGSLRIGDLSFEVPRAREVDQTAIDPDLPEPILAGVGSDILSRLVWTVDYEAGVLWIPTR